MQEFVDKNLNASFRVFYKDFLTEKEIENVIDGKDLWMDKTEVEARLKGTFHKGVCKSVETTNCSESVDVAEPIIKRRGRPAKA